MATTTNFGWETPDDTDLVKDGAAAMRTLGNSIDASFVDLKGGTTGQVLAKASNTDLDYTWVAQDDSNAIQNAIVDAKGDLISATAADTPARLAVGSNGQLLSADSSTSTGLKWIAAPAGGKVLQVVSTNIDATTNIASTSYTDITGLSVTITPTANTSKILVFAHVGVGINRDSTDMAVELRMLRASTTIMEPKNGYTGYSSAIQVLSGMTNVRLSSVNMMHVLDEPATTSATTYKIQCKMNTTANNGIAYCGWGGGNSATITVLEIGA